MRPPSLIESRASSIKNAWRIVRPNRFKDPLCKQYLYLVDRWPSDKRMGKGSEGIGSRESSESRCYVAQS